MIPRGQGNYLINHINMIFFRSPEPWSFFDYGVNERSLIEEWYQKELSEEAQFIFDGMLKNKQKIESFLKWTGIKYLQGKPKEESIWQLDFVADRR